MAPDYGSCPAHFASDARPSGDALRRALKNKRTAVHFYAAAALKWLEKDVPDTTSATESLHAMVGEIRMMNEVIARLDSVAPGD